MTQPPFCLPIASPWHKVHHLMPRGRGSSASIRRLLAPIPYSALRRRCSRGRGSRRLKTRTKSTNHADLVLLATISWSGELLLYSPRLGWMEGVKLSSQGASSLCLRGALVAQLLYLFLAWRRHLVPNEDLKGAAQTAQLLDRSFLLPPPRTVPYLYCSLLAPSSLSLSLPPSLFLFLHLSYISSSCSSNCLFSCPASCVAAAAACSAAVCSPPGPRVPFLGPQLIKQHGNPRCRKGWGFRPHHGHRINSQQ